MRTLAVKAWMGRGTHLRAVLGTGLVAGSFLLAGCGGGGAGGTGLTGEVRSDGSSTVFPVAEAVAEEFQIQNPRVRVTVGVSGTGGGISRFCAGETDLANASREMTAEERDRCAANGVEFIELPVAWDGLSVVVNPANDFIQCITVQELRRIWEPNSGVETWRDVRSDFPDEVIRLYGPGTDSGTFDYFTETLMGESGASRSDYQASEDDNVLVQGVSGDRYSLGYFGYAYYSENEGALKVLGVDGGTGCVFPSVETIDAQSYAPLSRPLYIYVKESAVERPEVEAYVRFMMDNSADLVPATGYIPLSRELYQENLEAVEEALAASTPRPDSTF